MQSIFRLPWCADHVSFRAGEKDSFVPVVTPAVDLAMTKQIKRKRAISSDQPVKQQSSNKKQRPSTATAMPGRQAISEIDTSTTAFKASSEKEMSKDNNNTASIKIQRSLDSQGGAEQVEKEHMSRTSDMDDLHNSAGQNTKLQQVIENQLNLQILLKHNELRLIDQELAKCQIALEQLRRCELKPYPGQEGFDQHISSGTGAAILPVEGRTQPSHAAPYGVVDGPYTRHYRRWLLQDDSFDSQSIHSISADDVHGRSTRYAGARKSLPAALMTPSRHGSDQLALSTLPVSVPKRDLSLPLVLRRSTDNKLVKLVCNNCNRGNMSSIQGFLNHCRIAHKVVYESHDAAAVDCGRVLDDAEIASLPTESQMTPAPKPVAKVTPSRAPSQATLTSTGISSSMSNINSVHPLNLPGAQMAKVESSRASEAKPIQTSAVSQPSHFASAPFKASTALPNLSVIFARRNAGGNLEQAAAEAKKKTEFGFDEMPSPASLTPGSPASNPQGFALNRSIGGKSQSQSTQRPRHSYFAPARTIQSSQLDDVSSPDHNSNLSPQTMDSNPGLVSDVEDDDNASASEEEATAPSHHIAHPLGISRTCAADDEISVSPEDGLQQHGVIIRRNSMLGTEHGIHTDGGPSRKLGGK